MLYQLIGFEALAAYAVIAGAIGRALKMWPTIPKRALPWVVVVAAYAIALLDQRTGGAPWGQAAAFAMWGIVSGAIAVSGHDLLKGLLLAIPGVDEDRATKLLGRVEDETRDRRKATRLPPGHMDKPR